MELVPVNNMWLTMLESLAEGGLCDFGVTGIKGEDQRQERIDKGCSRWEMDSNQLRAELQVVRSAAA